MRWDSSGCGFGRKTTSNKSTFKKTSICSCSFTEPCCVRMELYRGFLAEAHGERTSEKSWVGSQNHHRCGFLWERISAVIYLRCMVRPEGVQVSRFRNWDLKSSLSKLLSVQSLNISEALDLTGVKKGTGKQHRDTETTTRITESGFLHYSSLMHCSAGTATRSPQLIPVSAETALKSWHAHRHETPLRQENTNCPTGN